MKLYRFSAYDHEIMARAANPHDGIGANWALKYYFEREFRPWQWYLHHAEQEDLTVLGGVGAGKTIGMGLSQALWAASTPAYSFMNLAETLFQSKLMYDAILREADGKPFERMILRYRERPYPYIVIANDYIGQSELYFMSAADDSTRILGWEGDAMNLDEAGLILEGDQIIANMASRMRGNVKGRERLNRLSVITASYLTSPAWLWARMGMMHEDPVHFLSMIVKSEDNLSSRDMEILRRRIPKELQSSMLDAEKFEGAGVHFNLAHVAACEDKSLNRHMNHHTYERENPTPGWRYEENSLVGCVKWEMPSEAGQGRQYKMFGDPGTNNPPRRNAGCIGVFDITDFPTEPAQLVYFDWVYGHGSHMPFLLSYKHAWEKYRPLEAYVDSTGTQSLWDEAVLFNEGIWATGLDFAGRKNHMLTATQSLIERHKFRWPFVQGIRTQLVGYDITRDKQLAQDIVAMLMMAGFTLRQELWEDFETETQVAEPEPRLPENIRYTRGGIYIPRLAGQTQPDAPAYWGPEREYSFQNELWPSPLSRRVR